MDPGDEAQANLFSWATSELSQDALLCYLVDCASKGTGGLRECGKDFVRFLFRAGAKAADAPISGFVPSAEKKKPSPFPGELRLEGVVELQKQYAPKGKKEGQIDVYFQATIDGKTVTFLIEDKVDSGEHSGQLDRYMKTVRCDGQAEDFIKPIYLKTGYIFSNEQEKVEEAGYSIVTGCDLLAFFEKQDADRKDEILRQYEERLRRLVSRRKQALDDWNMAEPHVQWEFMLRLKDGIEKDCGPSTSPPGWTWQGVGRDQNKGGASAWTQYWFHKEFFWRVDAGRLPKNEDEEEGGGWWTLLRLMREGTDKQENKSKVEGEYRHIFREVLEGIDGLEAKPKRSWGKQMAVGAIEFHMSPDRMDDFLDRLVCFHRRFLQQIDNTLISQRPRGAVGLPPGV